MAVKINDPKNLLIKNFIKEYCKVNNIKCKFKKIKGGFADVLKSSIEIGIIGPNIEEYLFTVFHECAHIRCHREYIFPYYHESYKIKNIDYRIIRQQAFRAECKVDNMALEEFKIYFPDLNHNKIRFYADKDTITFNKKWLLKYWSNCE